MILLSKFKRFLNRFFGQSDDSHESHLAVEEEIAEQHDDDDDMVEIKRERPSFQFPIITDAEIYGWDEPTLQREPEQPRLDEGDYEPIPLYENERWPIDELPQQVFRAGSDLKYESEQVENQTFYAHAEIEEVRPKKKSSVQKMTNKRFIPTTVPSPIHGYATKKKMELHGTNQLENLESKEELAEEVISTEPLTLKDYPFVEKNKAKIVAEIEELENINDEQTTEKVSSQEIKTFVQEELDKVHNFATKIEEQEEVKLPLIERAEMEEEVPSVSIDVEEADEVSKEIENVPVEVEEKKEKVVPFNVLMLKSDKEKLAQAVSEKTDIKEQRAKKVEISGVEEINQMEEEDYYAFPSIDLLIPPESQIEDTEWLEYQSEKLEESLSHFGIQATVIEAMQGPTVTRFELTVGQGTKVSRVRNLTDDLKLALAAEDIRIQAPIPGRSSIGIEIPNRQTRPVRISEVIGTESFSASTSPLEAVLGLSLTGKPETLDLRKMPHGMIAGATGSGKSVCINSILVSLLFKAAPTDLKMMLIDPKMVELAPFNGIPHLISPVITDVKAATAALKWAVAEMERRYELLAHAGVRDIERYNKVAIENRRFSLKMPYLLIVIDELSDLMMMAPADVEISISRIAQKARACGIHLIIATQRPSVDVITGTIKANIPTRIAFAVSSQVDSRTIIDTAGADRLLGKGDMLYIGNGKSSPVRLQGTFVTDDEIERIIEHVKREASPNYLFGQDELLKNAIEEEETDPLFEDACFFIFEQGSASTSLLQRNFSIGYNRAAKLMDSIEKRGFISEQRGSRARDVLLTEADLQQLTEPTI